MKRNNKHWMGSLLLLAATLPAGAYQLDKIAPQAAPLTAGDSVYIYNPAFNLFLSHGEGWGSQVIGAEGTSDLYVPKQENGSYKLWCSYRNGHLWRTTSDKQIGNGIKGTFNDGNNAGTVEWDIQPVEGKPNVYTIAMPATNDDYVAGEYLGLSFAHASNWAANNNGGLTHGVYFDVQASDSVEWQFIPKANYEAFQLKATLANQIQISDSLGFDVNEAAAVYNNNEATLDEVQAAITKLLNERANAASVDNPVDLTGKVQSPDFENGTTGWKTTMQDKRLGTTSANANGTDITGKAWEEWVATGGLQGKMYQVIKGLQPGVYQVKMGLFVNQVNNISNSIDSAQYVYANNDRVAIDAKIKTYSILTTVGEDGQLEIGAAQTAPTATWYNMDNVKLFYLGNAVDAHKLQARVFAENLQNAFQQAKYAQGYYDAVVGSANQIDAATTVDEVKALYANLKENASALVKSIGLYQTAQEESERLETYVYQYGMDALSDYKDEVDQIVESATMLNEELETRLAELRALEVKTAKEQIDKGQRYPFIENDDFHGASVEGWNLTGDKEPPAGGYTGIVGFWSRSGWNLHQTLEGMKPGIWRMTMKGFYRTGNSSEVANIWRNANGANEGVNKVHTFMAMNQEQAAFKNYATIGLAERPTDGYWQEIDINGDGTTRFYPDDDEAASVRLNNNDDCLMTVSGLVGTDGIINLQIWNDDVNNAIGAEWSVFSGVKLYYEGADPDSIRPILNSVITKANGLLAHNMAATLKNSIQQAVTAATASAEGTDGIDMIEKYSALNTAINGAQESIDLYSQLHDKYNELQDVYDIYMDQASDEAKQVAEALSHEVEKALKDGTYNTAEEINGKIAQIDDAIFNLKIPYGEATDDNPQDWTIIINNPTYSNGIKGWTTDNATVEYEDEYGMGVVEGYDTDFDIYQDLENLNPGIYRVSVQGFYRQDNFKTGQKAFQYELAKKLGKTDLLTADDVVADEDLFVPRAKFYANADTLDMTNMFFIPENEEVAELFRTAPGTGWYEYLDSLTSEDTQNYFFCNTRQTAAQRFSLRTDDDKAFYENAAYVKVGEDGHLRIGVTLKNHRENDWVPFTNWTLTYYGTNSAHKPTGITSSAAEGGQPARVEYFTIDGRQVSRPVKGLNIIRITDSKGKTTVRKVIIK